MVSSGKYPYKVGELIPISTVSSQLLSGVHIQVNNASGCGFE